MVNTPGHMYVAGLELQEVMLWTHQEHRKSALKALDLRTASHAPTSTPHVLQTSCECIAGMPGSIRP